MDLDLGVEGTGTGDCGPCPGRAVWSGLVWSGLETFHQTEMHSYPIA